MNNVISFTPAELAAFIGTIAGVCAGIATIVGIIVKIIVRLKAPLQPFINSKVILLRRDDHK